MPWPALLLSSGWEPASGWHKWEIRGWSWSKARFSFSHLPSYLCQRSQLLSSSPPVQSQLLLTILVTSPSLCVFTSRDGDILISCRLSSGTPFLVSLNLKKNNPLIKVSSVVLVRMAFTFLQTITDKLIVSVWFCICMKYFLIRLELLKIRDSNS